MVNWFFFRKTGFQKPVLLNSVPWKKVRSYIIEFVSSPKVLIKYKGVDLSLAKNKFKAKFVMPLKLKI
jgi:hypothetical protein